jgi:hypothetical protein
MYEKKKKKIISNDIKPLCTKLYEKWIINLGIGSI